MKKSIIVGALFFSALIQISCSKENAPAQLEQKQSPVFEATIEQITKASLDTETRKVEWTSGDEITVVDAASNKAIYVASPKSGDPTRASFTIKSGETALGDGPYKAYYPASIVDGLPAVVVYYNDASNDIKNLPMAAVSETTNLDFKNLCAVIKLTLPVQAGYNFKSASFFSKTKVFSGEFTIDANGAAVMDAEGNHYSALNRANAKKMDAEQVYYMTLPAGTYDDLGILITNNAAGDQVFTIKKSQEFVRNTIYPLTLNCSNFRVTLSKDYNSKNPEMLYYVNSKTANCYQATSASGKYKFLPTKGEGGTVVEGIKSVRVLWEAQAGTTAPTAGVIVKNARYNKGYIEFDAGGSQGNALIAAYSGEDGTGDILWSWHIWRANTAFSDVNYPHGETMMDRNVGAFGNTANSLNSIGVYFQYGRKDPFTGRGANSNTYAAQTGVQKSLVKELATVETSIKNPTAIYYTSDKTNWSSENSKATWEGESKSQYDPCPYGYRVPTRAVWTTNGTDIDATKFSAWADNGTIFNSNQNYVATGQMTLDTGEMNSSNSIVFMWSRDLNPSGNAYILDVRSDGTKQFSGCARSNLIGLRCQKM